jgi:hypothetical protein
MVESLTRVQVLVVRVEPDETTRMAFYQELTHEADALYHFLCQGQEIPIYQTRHTEAGAMRTRTRLHGPMIRANQAYYRYLRHCSRDGEHIALAESEGRGHRHLLVTQWSGLRIFSWSRADGPNFYEVLHALTGAPLPDA